MVPAAKVLGSILGISISFLFPATGFGSEICQSVADKMLDIYHMGTFYAPASNVAKRPAAHADGKGKNVPIHYFEGLPDGSSGMDVAEKDAEGKSRINGCHDRGKDSQLCFWLLLDPKCKITAARIDRGLDSKESLELSDSSCKLLKQLKPARMAGSPPSQLPSILREAVKLCESLKDDFDPQTGSSVTETVPEPNAQAAPAR